MRTRRRGVRPPSLSSAQVREIDRLAAERFAIPVAWLMEAAGWQIARSCREPAYVMCGRGNNGGDGLAAARHLHRCGRLAGVCCTDAGGLACPAAEQAAALRAAGVDIAPEPARDFGGAPLIVDALLGTGLSRPVQGRLAEWIAAIDASGRRVLAVDVPSGVGSDSGDLPWPVVAAAVTVTFGAPKYGHVLPPACTRNGSANVPSPLPRKTNTNPCSGPCRQLPRAS